MWYKTERQLRWERFVGFLRKSGGFLRKSGGKIRNIGSYDVGPFLSCIAAVFVVTFVVFRTILLIFTGDTKTS